MMTLAQTQQARYALDERIIQLLTQGKAQEAATAYSAYLEVGGYFEMHFFQSLADIRRNGDQS